MDVCQSVKTLSLNKDMVLTSEICPDMHALAKMAEMAINGPKRQAVKQTFK